MSSTSQNPRPKIRGAQRKSVMIKQQIALKSVVEEAKKNEEMNENEIDNLAALLGKFRKFL